MLKNVNCLAHASLSSSDNLIVSPPPNPPPKPNSSKPPDIIIVGPKPETMSVRHSPKKSMPQHQNSGAGAPPPAAVTTASAQQQPSTTTVAPPPAATVQAGASKPASTSPKGFAPYIPPHACDRGTPPTSGGAHAPAAAAEIGVATGAVPKNNSKRQENVIGIDDDKDDSDFQGIFVPEVDLRVDKSIEKNVVEKPEQKLRWRQFMALTIHPKQDYMKSLKLVTTALKNKNQWQQLNVLVEQMEMCFSVYKNARVRAMSERDIQITNSDHLLNDLTAEFLKTKGCAKEYIQQQQQLEASTAAANKNVENMTILAEESEKRLCEQQARVASASGGAHSFPAFTEAGTVVTPPFSHEGATATTVGQTRLVDENVTTDQNEPLDLDDNEQAMSVMSMNTRETSPSLTWDHNNGGQGFWDASTNSWAQHIDPKLTNQQIAKKARFDQQQQHHGTSNMSTMIPPGAGGAILATSNQALTNQQIYDNMSRQQQQQLQQQMMTNVTYVHQPQPRVAQPGLQQQWVHSGLPVTRSSAAQLTTSSVQQPPLMAQQQQVVGAPAHFQYMAPPLSQVSYMAPNFT